MEVGMEVLEETTIVWVNRPWDLTSTYQVPWPHPGYLFSSIISVHRTHLSRLPSPSVCDFSTPKFAVQTNPAMHHHWPLFVFEPQNCNQLCSTKYQKAHKKAIYLIIQFSFVFLLFSCPPPDWLFLHDQSMLGRKYPVRRFASLRLQELQCKLANLEVATWPPSSDDLQTCGLRIRDPSHSAINLKRLQKSNENFWFFSNFCQVIATQFSETKKREMERMRLERARYLLCSF